MAEFLKQPETMVTRQHLEATRQQGMRPHHRFAFHSASTNKATDSS